VPEAGVAAGWHAEWQGVMDCEKLTKTVLVGIDF